MGEERKQEEGKEEENQVNRNTNFKTSGEEQIWTVRRVDKRKQKEKLQEEKK